VAGRCTTPYAKQAPLGRPTAYLVRGTLRSAKAHLLHSRRGECCDNAQVESRWSHLKTELLDHRDWPVFADLADTQARVATYFICPNHDRRHSSS
jgi:putative transposase